MRELPAVSGVSDRSSAGKRISGGLPVANELTLQNGGLFCWMVNSAIWRADSKRDEEFASQTSPASVLAQTVPLRPPGQPDRVPLTGGAQLSHLRAFHLRFLLFTSSNSQANTNRATDPGIPMRSGKST